MEKTNISVASSTFVTCRSFGTLRCSAHALLPPFPLLRFTNIRPVTRFFAYYSNFRICVSRRVCVRVCVCGRAGNTRTPSFLPAKIFPVRYSEIQFPPFANTCRLIAISRLAIIIFSLQTWRLERRAPTECPSRNHE